MTDSDNAVRIAEASTVVGARGAGGSSQTSIAPNTGLSATTSGQAASATLTSEARALRVLTPRIEAHTCRRQRAPPFGLERGPRDQGHGQVPERRLRHPEVTRRAGSGALRFGTFRRSLRAGAVIEVLVTRPGAVGRYVRFRVRTGAAPLRTDLCLSSRGRRQRCL